MKKQTIMKTRMGVWAGVFGGAGVLHMVVPQFFDQIVPEALPGRQRWWTIGSGVVELGLAGLLGAGIAKPELREPAGQTAAAFLLAVWPGNIKMAWDWRDKDAVSKAVAWGRVPAQLPMIASVLKIK